MEIKNIVNNGVQIPNECTCIWCGSKMRRGGANRMGVGVNSFALWCDNCGAVVVHACDFGKKITGYEVKWDVKQAGKQEFPQEMEAIICYIVMNIIKTAAKLHLKNATMVVVTVVCIVLYIQMRNEMRIFNAQDLL